MATEFIVTTEGDGFEELLALFEDPGERQKAFRVMGTAVNEGLRQYHRDYALAKKWINPEAFTHGPGRQKTNFGQDIVSGWSSTATADGATVVNADPRLNLKLKGGTISAKRARALTIPVDPQAHGRRARDFEIFTNLKLFRPRGKNYLVVNEGGRFRVIYILRKRVTLAPWPGAMPSRKRVLAPASRELLRLIDEALE